MGMKDRLAALVGLAGDRDGVPPSYRLIAPGLIVTDESAWAWFIVQTTNSDLAGEVARDREQDKADLAWRTLRGREWHLKGLWGSISGTEYLHGLDLDAVDDEGNLMIPTDAAERVWAAERADDLDYAELRTKTRLLGVKLKNRASTANTKSRTALGLDDRRVPIAEQRQLLNAARQLGRTLGETVWRCRLAAPETLAWSIGRELHRDTKLPVPDSRGLIEGAPLHRLCSGRVIPMSDHLLFMGAHDEVVGYGAVLALTDFPEDLTTPGQEWLGVLNGLKTEASGNELGDPVDVLAEESMRGSIPTARQALTTVDNARKSAKEQRRSAEKASAGEADDSITLAEDEARDMLVALKRRQTMLVHDHPRITVSADTREELNAKVSAVEAAYEDMGITATLCPDEQRELWLETLPCDKVRVSDLGHWREVTALSASWFWGGSRVGSTDSRIPAIGYTTGSTQQLVRFLATEAVELSDAPVTVFTGRTRRGKTTAMQLCLLDVCLGARNYGRRPWAALMDTKGDTGGLIAAAKMYNIATYPLKIDEHAAEMRGQLCGFLTSDPQHAVETVTDQLKLLTPSGDLLSQTGHYIVIATGDVAKHEQPRSYKVIDRLAEMAEEADAERALKTLVRTLQAVTESGWGALVAGRPIEGTSRAAMPTQEGITLISVPGLFQSLPSAQIARDEWDDRQRASIAVLRGLLSWCTSVAASPELRGRPKVVAVPEVHTLTATHDGRSFLEQQARMGAAAGLSMLLDTQDVSGIASMTGLAESISAVFGFSQYTEEEQRALMKMLKLADDESTMEIIGELDEPSDGDLVEGHDEDAVRRGHCIYLDRRKQAATIQWRMPSQEIVDTLNTSAAAQAARHEADQRRDEARQRLEGEELAHV